MSAPLPPGGEAGVESPDEEGEVVTSVAGGGQRGGVLHLEEEIAGEEFRWRHFNKSEKIVTER